MTEAALIDALLTFLQRQDTTDEDFNRMALAVFAYQFEHNLPYRRFAMQRGRTPFTVEKLACHSRQLPTYRV